MNCHAEAKISKKPKTEPDDPADIIAKDPDKIAEMKKKTEEMVAKLMKYGTKAINLDVMEPSIAADKVPGEPSIAADKIPGEPSIAADEFPAIAADVRPVNIGSGWTGGFDATSGNTVGSAGFTGPGVAGAGSKIIFMNYIAGSIKRF